jgi:hypothetical protein
LLAPTFEPAGVFADLVKAEGTRRGADHVRQLTILGDGAAWICYPDASCHAAHNA